MAAILVFHLQSRPSSSATGIGCNTGFDMDSVVITLGGNLPPGNYTIQIETGTDGNNLLDNCGRSIPASQITGNRIPVGPTQWTAFQQLVVHPVDGTCFRDPMFCNSIAADGSDFTVTGPAGYCIRRKRCL